MATKSVVRLIGSGIQEQLLCSGWKRVSDRTCGKYGIATEPDWRGHNVQVAVAVGKDKFLLAAECCVFTLQHRPHMVETFRRQITAGQLGDGLIAMAGECNENEIGIQHRNQRSDDAAADLAHIIILPSGRKR